MVSLVMANWQVQVGSVKWAADLLAYGVFPKLAERAKREAEEFGKLPPPKDPSETALMIANASIMQGSWSSEFLIRAALHANAQVLANTQKVFKALLHQPSAPNGR